jgi:hypothetical protein
MLDKHAGASVLFIVRLILLTRNQATRFKKIAAQ